MENRIRELRGEQRWSQAELAGRLGVSRQTVNALETGRYVASLPLAFAIARLFGMAIEEIFRPGGGVAPLPPAVRTPPGTDFVD